MSFNVSRFGKLTTTTDDGKHCYLTNRKKPFGDDILIDLSSFVDKSFEFAYNMTFGNVGQHRDHRTGGREIRKNGQIFINAFQGKICEFGLWNFFSNNGFLLDEPDIGEWSKGTWDDTDLIINGSKINVKSAVFFSNLLLLETKDWDEHAYYLPNEQDEETAYSYFVLCRTNPDGKKCMQSHRLFYSDIASKSDLDWMKSEKWEMDIAGYITRQDLIQIIQSNNIIPQGGLLNGKIPMDASNYYCQAGDMRNINELVKLLKQ